MTYKVEVAEPVRKKISGWRLSKPLEIAFYQELLERLETGAARDIGRRIVAPVPCIVCRIAVSDPSAGGRESVFIVWAVERGTPITRYVIEATPESTPLL